MLKTKPQYINTSMVVPAIFHIDLAAILSLMYKEKVYVVKFHVFSPVYFK